MVRWTPLDFSFMQRLSGHRYVVSSKFWKEVRVYSSGNFSEFLWADDEQGSH